MPRPGPRPYECIRRAWHSDRHQPMRGSLIQEIFRVVNEIHSSATKKNKEWQDKLPLVVLKAEEIMYSKANSEAEYMDLKTLWERTNDAINTIIRRDESSESGELLQPCIEAALNLGCTPRRASRSQRHNTPRFYLTPNMQEATTQVSVAPKNSEIFPYDGSCRLLPPCPKVPIPNSSPEFFSYYSSLLTSMNVNSTQLGSDSCDPVSPDESMPHEQRNPLPISSGEFPPFPKNFALSWKDKSSLPMDPLLSVGMHPLHNSTKHLVVESGSGFLYPQGSNHDANMLSMPHVRPIEEARSGLFQNHLGCDNAVDASNRAISRSLNFAGTSENPHVGCDLSLRLWPLRTPCLSAENSPNVEDAGSSSHDKFCDPSTSRMRTGHYDCSSSSPRRHQGFCFFPGESSKAPWNDTQVNGVTRGKI